MSNKDIPTIEVDIDPVVQSVETFEKLGVSEASFNAFRQNVNGRVQANTDAIGVLDGRVQDLTADRIVLRNLITNGDFSKGTEGWSEYNGAIAVEDGRLAITPKAQYRGANQAITLVGGHKYYFRWTLDASVNENALISGIVPSSVFKKTNGIETVGVAFDAPDSTPRYINIITSRTGGFVKFYANSMMLIDLTATFGAGNEPTKEEMDKLIDLLGGWFDGEITVSQKQLAIWTLNLIRQNRNAIIALGGTII